MRGEGQYRLSFSLVTSSGNASCQKVVVAAGFQSHVKLPAKMEPLVHGYESLSKDPEQFEGKHVVVLGGGNAAFETAEALANYAHVTIFHRYRDLGWTAAKSTTDEDEAQKYYEVPAQAHVLQ
jgi:thioredoxin reductase